MKQRSELWGKGFRVEVSHAEMVKGETAEEGAARRWRGGHRSCDRSARQGLLVQIPKLKAPSSERPIWSYIQQVTGLRHSRKKQGGHTGRQDLRFSHRSHITHTHHTHTHMTVAQPPIPSGPVWTWPSTQAAEGLSPYWWH